MNSTAAVAAAAPEPGAGVGNAALELVRWTTISADEALVIYDVVAEQRRNLVSSKAAIARLAEFADIPDVRQRLIMALSQSAFDAGALPQYCQAIVGRERSRGRPEAELAQIIGRIGSPGTAHAIVDRARRLIPTTMFGVLDKLTQAIGFVEVADGAVRRIIGTAFLVRRDVVITSAHVAFEAMDKDRRIATEPPVRDITRISFPATPAGQQDARLVTKPELTFSEAHMIGVGKLDPQVTAAALERLDFVLLRLDRPIDRVEPIKITGRSVPTNGPLSFLIGFPGGMNAAHFDAHQIVRDLSVGGRLIHMINSVPGMSGGCVIADNGVPIGIHEGAIPRLDQHGLPLAPVDGVEQVENRAVLLTAISQHLSRLDPDPLAAVPQSTGFVMFEEALVTRLGRRGAQLLADPVSQMDWERLLALVTAPLPTGELWTAHPWFTDRDRARIQKWFATAALSADSRSRIAFINGPRGSGKTFMIDVLKRVAADAGSDLFRVAWSEGDSTVAALGRQLATTFAVSGTRTSEGHERYENVPALIDALARYGLPADASGSRPRRLFVAIDAGDGTGSVTEPDIWIELVVALSQQPWARVVLCGLPEDLVRRVEDALPEDIESQPFAINYVRSADIVRFLGDIGMLPGATQSAEAAAAAFDAAEMPHRSRPELTTAMAALFAIGWHRGILPPSGGQQ
ncbi:trypsin-like serine peptidase [Xanthobacter sediminis]